MKQFSQEISNTCENDTFIVKLCGMRLASLAKTIDDVMVTITVISKAVMLDPEDDSLCYSLGLEYRTLWIQTDKAQRASLTVNV